MENFFFSNFWKNTLGFVDFLLHSQNWFSWIESDHLKQIVVLFNTACWNLRIRTENLVVDRTLRVLGQKCWNFFSWHLETQTFLVKSEMQNMLSRDSCNGHCWFMNSIFSNIEECILKWKNFKLCGYWLEINWFELGVSSIFLWMFSQFKVNFWGSTIFDFLLKIHVLTIPVSSSCLTQNRKHAVWEYDEYVMQSGDDSVATTVAKSHLMASSSSLYSSFHLAAILKKTKWGN